MPLVRFLIGLLPFLLAIVGALSVGVLGNYMYLGSGFGVIGLMLGLALVGYLIGRLVRGVLIGK